ncbi:WG repeat-containing protein [Sphingobacterium sp. E70]|uniref:WG repeat-containing protein n=1 Tax=Sphingobacterium sp. E70 TaxID=2853439 RepID=UPI00211CC6C8|nr:WG repeat-containing protein [Sphingobacterium sp. E70]ULT27000.1 WG repeat-containing protein [Sphingobacterium sp. E70]
MLDRFEPQFTEAMFQGLKKLNYYQSAIEKDLKVLLGDNKNADVFDVIKKLRAYIESNEEYLGPVEQRLSISFPYPVKQFLLYFGKSNETIKAERQIPVSRTASYGYMTYLDQEAKKYGIVDSMGNVIIEPRFKELTRSSQDYFFDSSDSIDYFLNVKDKKLEPVKAGYRFERKLNADLSVFKNKKENLGVLRNGQEEIVPFKYTAIEKQGKLFVANYTLRGRETFDLYTLKGDLIETPLLSTVDMLADSSFMVRSKLHKFGVLNTSGKLVIPLEYDKIEGLKTANWVYVTKGRETFC